MAFLNGWWNRSVNKAFILLPFVPSCFQGKQKCSIGRSWNSWPRKCVAAVRHPAKACETPCKDGCASSQSRVQASTRFADRPWVAHGWDARCGCCHGISLPARTWCFGSFLYGQWKKRETHFLMSPKALECPLHHKQCQIHANAWTFAILIPM